MYFTAKGELCLAAVEPTGNLAKFCHELISHSVLKIFWDISFLFLPIRHHWQLFEIVSELQTPSLRFYIVGATTYPPSSHRGGMRLSAMHTMSLPAGQYCQQAGIMGSFVRNFARNSKKIPVANPSPIRVAGSVRWWEIVVRVTRIVTGIDISACSASNPPGYSPDGEEGFPSLPPSRSTCPTLAGHPQCQERSVRHRPSKYPPTPCATTQQQVVVGQRF